MATPVIMPKFGMAQEEGTILRWHKVEGDHVRKGDVILEVMTDKVDMEVEALSDGILAGVRYGPDTTLPVTTVIAYLLAPGEELPADAAAPIADASFQDALKQVAADSVQTLSNAEAISIQGLSGKAQTREVVDAVMQAEQTLQTAIAIRDKIVTAYLELSRMSI